MQVDQLKVGMRVRIRHPLKDEFTEATCIRIFQGGGFDESKRQGYNDITYQFESVDRSRQWKFHGWLVGLRVHPVQVQTGELFR